METELTTAQKEELEAHVNQLFVQDAEREALQDAEREAAQSVVKVVEAKVKKSHGGARVGAGRPRKYVLTIEDYCNLFVDLGYHLAKNTLDDTIECNGKTIEDADIEDLLAQIFDYCTINGFAEKISQARRCIYSASNKNAYNPIQNYFGNLPEWDGADHISEVASHFTDKHNTFARWFEVWLVGCVAKVYDNAYQNPVLVLLTDDQGVGKGTFAEWLCPFNDRFHSGAIDPTNKDHVLMLATMFIWELSELTSTTYKKSVDALKSFLTLSRARLRKAYGRSPINKPAICSFIATTNNAKSLVDNTGNRRFLVSDITAIDWNYTQVDLDQLWAQAKHKYLTSDDWKLTASEKALQKDNNLIYTRPDDLFSLYEKHLVVTGKPDDVLAFNDVWIALTDRFNVPQSQYRNASIKLASWAKQKEGVNFLHTRERNCYTGLRLDSVFG